MRFAVPLPLEIALPWHAICVVFKSLFLRHDRLRLIWRGDGVSLLN